MHEAEKSFGHSGPCNCLITIRKWQLVHLGFFDRSPPDWVIVHNNNMGLGIFSLNVAFGIGLVVCELVLLYVRDSG